MARWEDAEVPERKILAYLLSSEHPTGREKAAFFTAIGYTRQHWTRLRNDLLAAARACETVREEQTEFGVKYVLDTQVLAPSGRRIALRTIWISDKPEDAPRLVTVYPRKGDTRDVRGT